MKAMILSDLAISRRSLVQLLGLCAVISLFIGGAMGTLVPVGACFAAMVPLMFLFSVAAYDEMNQWQTFRLSLPISRSGVVAGRYAGVFLVTVTATIIGAAFSYIVSAVATAASPSIDFLAPLAFSNNPHEAIWGGAAGGMIVALLMTAVSLPLVTKMGMTRGVRFAPLAVVVVLIGGGALFGEDGPLAGVAPRLLAWLPPDDSPLLLAIVVIAVVALFALSMLVSFRLYAKREL